MRRAVVLFTRDLRVHDNPALHEAVRLAREIVPLFVLDPRIPAPPNRTAFLADCLADLDASLRARGGRLVVRRGDPVRQVLSLTPDAVFLSDDVSAFAQERLERLSAERIAVRAEPGVTVIPPGEVTPVAVGHYRVFTPYFNAWRAAARRPVLPAPGRIAVPDAVEGLPLPVRPRPSSPALARGGETLARGRMSSYVAGGLRRYAERNDIPSLDGTSRLSPYLHFGCLSPLELAACAAASDAFVRQLCWRDFHHQLLADRPETSRDDIHPGRRMWRHDPEGLAAWKRGETGVPLVDAGMRQLLREGWMHNRVRMVVASYLTKDLEIDWREGARHFMHWLVDGDVANNSGNWQWVAGTGADTRPHRKLSPYRQAERFDPGGEYVRRYLG